MSDTAVMVYVGDGEQEKRNVADLLRRYDLPPSLFRPGCSCQATEESDRLIITGYLRCHLYHSGFENNDSRVFHAVFPKSVSVSEPVNPPEDSASEAVNHPAHYGGEDNPYEAIKVIEAWGLGFHLGNAVKYIARAGKKGDAQEDLKKAAWYLNRAIENE